MNRFVPERIDLSRCVDSCLEAEMCLLGSICLDPGVVPEVLQHVGRGDFYSPAHQVIFDALLALVEQKKLIDAVTLHDELERRTALARVGGIEYIDQIIEAVPSPANAVNYASIVHEKAIQRAGIQILEEGLARLKTPGVDGQAMPSLLEYRDRLDAVVKDLGAKDAGEEAAIAEESAAWPAFPEALFDAGPTFRRWTDLQRETTEAPEVYHWAGCFTLYGAAITRRSYTVAAARHYPQFWTLLVGPPGDKKSTVLDRVTCAARSLNGELVLRNGWGSAEGFIKSVAVEKADSPTVLLSLSEMATFIRKTMGQASMRVAYSSRGNGSAGGGASTVCNLYDAACRTVDNSTAGGETKLENPLILLLGATVPESAAVLVSDDAIESGLASRFTFFCGRSTRFLARPPEPDPSEVDQVLQHVRKAASYAASVGRLELSPEADALYSDWYKRFARSRESLTKRLDAHLLRAALIFAIDSRCDRVEAKHVSSAIAFTEYLAETYSFLREQFSSSRLGKLENRIVEVLHRKPQGLSYREIQQLTTGGKTPADLLHTALGRLVQRRIVSKNGKLYFV